MRIFMKMDPHLISNEPHELDAVTARFGCTRKVLRELKKAYNHSRDDIYKALLELGYTDKKEKDDKPKQEGDVLQ